MQPDIGEVERRVERFKQRAKEVGLKLTHQRIEIFREVASRTDHPSAEAVLKSLNARMPTLSHDTVYRTLWTLNGLGLVSTLGPKRDSLRFDANVEPHHHYVCQSCGKVSDFHCAGISSVDIPQAVSRFGSIGSTHLEVRGICTDCTEQQAAE